MEMSKDATLLYNHVKKHYQPELDSISRGITIDTLHISRIVRKAYIECLENHTIAKKYNNVCCRDVCRVLFSEIIEGLER